MNGHGPDISDRAEGRRTAVNGDSLRALVIAGDSLVRAGLAVLLEEQTECTVIGRVPPHAGVQESIERLRPDVVVWDTGWEPSLAIGEADGMPPILALVPGEAQAAEAWSTGARGIVPRDADGAAIAAAIGALVQGLAVLPPSTVPPLLSPKEQAPAAYDLLLTPRELEVIQLLAEGLANKQIADRLGISDHTVKFHVNAILGKLDVHSRTEAVTRAARRGLIEL